jgi:D-arabinose 1-dehydrogenase-like Zn-dependent alcohol dehydrogenase
MTGNGCFAERVIANPRRIVPIPGDMPMTSPAVFTMTMAPLRGSSVPELQPETLLVLSGQRG